MVEKKYYAERKNGKKREKYDFTKLKRFFLNLYRKLEEDCYFQEFFGYDCTDGDVVGKLGMDIGAEIFLQTGLEDVWPVYTYIDYYNESDLFTMIEFLFDNVSEPKNKFYHSWNQCGYHATKFDVKKGQEGFVNEINKLLEGYEENLYLSKNGEVRVDSSKGHEELILDEVLTGDSKNVDDRISYAISKFFHFNSGIEEKKDAVRTLGDVLEFYKKQGIKLDKKDDSDLFNIMNNFDIRHHNTNQSGGYTKEIWYEWMFYTFLASIRAIQKLNNLV